MARDLRPKHKLCRKFGEKLCDAQKCPVTRRNYPPGIHGPHKKYVKLSGFGKQLQEKQKAKRTYGILEKQFANYVTEASKKTGDTGKFLLSYLESRLDNVVYRMALAPTRSAARQLVSHGHINVNNKKVDIASFRVRVGDVVSVKESALKSKLFEGVAERLAKVDFPAWLNVEANKVLAKVLNVPMVENPRFDAKSIIEFYSR